MHYAFLLSAYSTTASFLREMDPGIRTRPVAVPGGPIHIPKRIGAVAAFELSMVFVKEFRICMEMLIFSVKIADIP